MVLAVVGAAALLSGCVKQKFTKLLVSEQTRQAGWLGLIQQPQASFSPEQIARARDGSFRPTAVYVIPRPLHGPLYVVEAEGFHDAPPVPRTDPPLLTASLGDMPELTGPTLLMWNMYDTHVRSVDMTESRAALIELTGDKIPELMLWSRCAEVGSAPEHSKVAVFDLNTDHRQSKPPLLSLIVQHDKLKPGHQMVFSPLEAGRFGLVLFDVSNTSPGEAISTRLENWEWDQLGRRFVGPLGGGHFAWSSVIR
jgi:hypothetical protein